MPPVVGADSCSIGSTELSINLAVTGASAGSAAGKFAGTSSIVRATV